MTPAEAQLLLTIAASSDGRKPDAEAAQAWAIMLDGYRFEDCRDAIVAHYRRTREWLMPSDVINDVKHIRRDRLLKFGPLLPPPELADDVAAEQEWTYHATRRIADGEVTSQDQLHDRGELVQRDMSKLLEVTKPVAP